MAKGVEVEDCAMPPRSRSMSPRQPATPLEEPAWRMAARLVLGRAFVAFGYGERLGAQFAESARLEQVIKAGNLNRLGYVSS